MHDDRHAPLVGQREDPAHRRVTQKETLRARMELDTGRAALQRALDFRAAIGTRIDATERDQLSICGLSGGKRQVVRGSITARRGQRKDDRARVDHIERAP